MNPRALLVLTPALLAAGLPSTPDLGKAEGRCRPGETGPALIVMPVGLKDRQGTFKLEVYPSNDDDFLQDDNILVAAGKVFRRVEIPASQLTAPGICVRLPGPGAYSVSLLHDRDGNRRFGWTVDGIGFSGNPHLGWRKPKADAARVIAGTGLTHISITMNYRSGLGVAPLKQPRTGS